MKTKTISGQCKQSLALYEPDGSTLVVSNGRLSLIQQGESFFACCFQFDIDFSAYKKIEEQELFNLKKELRGRLDKGFSSESPITITATLQPELLPRLQPYLEDASKAVDYLTDLSQNHVDDALVNTRNWYITQFEQSQGIDKIGYRTFWDYLNLSDKTDKEGGEKQVLNAVFGFAQEQLGANTSVIDQELQGGVEKLLVQDIFDSVNTDLQELFQSLLSQELKENQKSSEETAIFEQALAFFKEDDWSIQIDEEQSGFRMMAQGENGQWPCYAQALDEKKQFVFYSISPVNVPQSQIPRVLDFLNRINLELMVGNFQLDPKDGQVVCKTSVDVGSDQLSTALVKQVVYNNVLTMNQCLPGLMSMIYANLSPEQALAKVFES